MALFTAAAFFFSFNGEFFLHVFSRATYQRNARMARFGNGQAYQALPRAWLGVDKEAVGEDVLGTLTLRSSGHGRGRADGFGCFLPGTSWGCCLVSPARTGDPGQGASVST